MSIESLDASLIQIKDIIDRQKQLIGQNDALAAENTRLKAENDSLRTLIDRVADLERRLEDARRTKKTIQRIEELEGTISSHVQELGELKTQRIKDSENTVVAQMYVERLTYIANKLKIKPGNRTSKALLSAIEDAVRKLV